MEIINRKQTKLLDLHYNLKNDVDKKSFMDFYVGVCEIIWKY